MAFTLDDLVIDRIQMAIAEKTDGTLLYTLTQLNEATIETKFKRDTEKECMEDRVATLEKHDNWQYKEILKISKGIDDIKENLVKREITDKAKTVATLRGQLYGLK